MRLTNYCATFVDNDLQMGEDRTYHSHIILSPEVYTSLCNMTSGERMRTYWRQGRGLRQGLYTCRSEVSRNNYINFCKPKYIFDSRTLLRYLEFLTFSQCCKCWRRCYSSRLPRPSERTNFKKCNLEWQSREKTRRQGMSMSLSPKRKHQPRGTSRGIHEALRRSREIYFLPPHPTNLMIIT